MTEAFPTLFSPIKLGPLTLRNRIAMAPLTRQMAEADGTPNDEMAAYYARRARGGLGLIITEGTYEQDAFQSRAYLSQPGIANASHQAGWAKVCDAVHQHDCKIIIQLMHGGRVSDPRVLDGQPSVSASATQSPGWSLYTDTDYEKQIRGIDGPWDKVTFGPARALTTAELHQVADGFAAGAKRAVDAGADGVEVHGANGYLLWQFINPRTNLRTDEFGGSPENNIRFARLVGDKVRAAIGPDKLIVLRLSQDGVDDFVGAWPGTDYARAIGTELKGSAYDALHWASFNYLENRQTDDTTPMAAVLRAASGLPMITNGGIADGPQAEAALISGAADMVAIGRPVFAQPDWPFIVRSGASYDWAPFDRKYVVRPPLDYGIAYPLALTDPNWPTV
ncbi:MAG: NADH:flavin oxidoreductase [Pseudorhodobacter sp.]|nr:NADH:flavin oxidoreductase [Pseudorhodobacter sp.]